MLIKDIIGKTITDIYTIIGPEKNGLNTAECFIELDGKIIIDIPFGESETLSVKEFKQPTESIFENVSDYPVYSLVNKEPRLTGYKENKTKYIQRSRIKDYLWYNDESERGLLLLDNGYVITEMNTAPVGIGVGIKYYLSLEEMMEQKGNDFKRYSATKLL